MCAHGNGPPQQCSQCLGVKAKRLDAPAISSVISGCCVSEIRAIPRLGMCPVNGTPRVLSLGMGNTVDVDSKVLAADPTPLSARGGRRDPTKCANPGFARLSSDVSRDWHAGRISG
jgi:hypothetical protein